MTYSESTGNFLFPVDPLLQNWTTVNLNKTRFYPSFTTVNNAFKKDHRINAPYQYYKLTGEAFLHSFIFVQFRI